MDKETWWAAVHGVTESDVTEWLSTRYSIVWVYYILFIYSSTDGYLGFYFFMNNTAKNIYVQVFVWMCVCISLGYVPRNGVAKSYGNCSVVWGIVRLFSKAAAPFYILSSNVWGLQFLQTQWHLLLSWFFDSGHPSKMCKMVSWYVFTWCWAFCLVLIGHLCIFLGEVAIQIPCPFLNFLCIYFWLGCVLVVAASRGCSSVAVAQTSHCGGFSLRSVGTRVHRPQ